MSSAHTKSRLTMPFPKTSSINENEAEDVPMLLGCDQKLVRKLSNNLGNG